MDECQAVGPIGLGLRLLCRFLGRLDDEYIDALDGRRPRSAKARNRGK